jgi:hypothetical protein
MPAAFDEEEHKDQSAGRNLGGRGDREYLARAPGSQGGNQQWN